MMADWAARRFWSHAGVLGADAGWQIVLDNRPVKTPAKAPLIVPTQALAQAIAKEWHNQERAIDPATMPLTRASNSAIDRVAPHRAELVEMLAAYGETDLLCYRADGPEALVQRQAEAWDPFLDWATESLDAPLVTATGIVHVAQPRQSIENLQSAVAQLDPFTLAAFHDLVVFSGSLVLAFAAIRRFRSPSEIWEVSRVDEAWQEEQWGRDEEASQFTLRKREDFLQAMRLFDLICAEN